MSDSCGLKRCVLALLAYKKKKKKKDTVPRRCRIKGTITFACKEVWFLRIHRRKRIKGEHREHITH